MAVDDPVDPDAATLPLPAVGAAGSAESIALADLVGLEPPDHRRADVEFLVGLPHSEMVRWWRAMGFAEVPEELVAFGDSDVDMARRLAALVGNDVLSQDEVLRLTRVLGASFSRIAKAQAGVLEDLLATRMAEEGDGHDSRLDELLATFGTREGRELLGLLEDSVLYVWRRHLLAALSRWVGTGESEAVQAVGFADISDFSGLTKSLQEADRISEIVDEFEATAFDVVASHGGRVVKMIGDEVMFVADDVAPAVDIALDLVDRLAHGPNALQIHCGIAHGPTVTIGGDVFGPTANLASRLTDVARRGKVVLPRDLSEELAGRDDLVLHRVRRVFELKGIGRTRMCTVSRREAVLQEATDAPVEAGVVAEAHAIAAGTPTPGDDPIPEDDPVPEGRPIPGADADGPGR